MRWIVLLIESSSKARGKSIIVFVSLLMLVIPILVAQEIGIKNMKHFSGAGNNVEYTISVIEMKQLKDEVGIIYNYRISNNGLWVSSNKGIFLYDGNRLHRHTVDNASNYYYRDLFQIDENFLLVGLQRVDDDYFEVSKTYTFDTRTGKFKDINSPVKGFLLQWKSKLILFNRNQYYQLESGSRWIPVEPDSELIQMVSQFFADFNQEEINAEKTLDNSKPFMVFSSTDGRISFDLRCKSTKAGEYLLSRVLYENGKITSRPLLKFPMATKDGEKLFFYSRQTNEFWRYDSDTGYLYSFAFNSQEEQRFPINLQQYFKNGTFNSLYCDQNNIWISISHSEILWIRKRNTHHMRLVELGKSVRSIYEEDGITLLGTYSGLLKANSTQLIERPLDLGEISYPIYLFHKLKDGRTLFLAPSRILVGNSSEFEKPKEYTAQFQFGEPWCIEERGQFLFLGTNYGLFYHNLTSGEWKNIPIGDSDAPLCIHGFIVINDNTWLAYGESGFYKMQFVGDLLVSCKPYFSINTIIFSVYKESDRRWWLCTSTGLFAYNPLDCSIEYLETLLFLQGLQVYSAYPDKQGNLWCSSEDGIFFINRERTNSLRFHREVGKKWEFNRNAHFRSRDGSLLFGGIGGLCWFNPGEVYLPRGIDEEIHVYVTNGKQKDCRKMESGVWEVRTLEEQLHIGFRGFWISTKNDRYAYRIRGKDWQVGHGESIQLSQLPIGNFTVELYKEVEGQWIRLNDLTIRRALVSWDWLLILVCSVFAVVGIRVVIYRGRKNGFLKSQVLTMQEEHTGKLYTEQKGKVSLDLEDRLDTLIESAAYLWKERIDGVLEMHYSNPELDITGLARLLATSRRQLYRGCTEYLGSSPLDYLIQFRLNKAVKILSHSPRIQITELCYKTGFKTPSHFSKRFQEKFGIPPKSYAQKLADTQSSTKIKKEDL